MLRLGAEQDRCDTLLALLLPPTIAAEVKSKKSARDLLENGFDDVGGSKGASGEWDPSRGISSLGEERYAESFSEASVLFAESECGTWRFFTHLPPFPPLARFRSLSACGDCALLIVLSECMG